jgi:hypothetical protein
MSVPLQTLNGMLPPIIRWIKKQNILVGTGYPNILNEASEIIDFGSFY